MSAKDKPAISVLFELLEARFALRVLWALRDSHAQTFRLLQDSVGGITPNTLNTRIKELRAAGLLTRSTGGYLLTPLGLDLCRRMVELPSFASRWQSAQVRQEASQLAAASDARSAQTLAKELTAPTPANTGVSNVSDAGYTANPKTANDDLSSVTPACDHPHSNAPDAPHTEPSATQGR